MKHDRVTFAILTKLFVQRIFELKKYVYEKQLLIAIEKSDFAGKGGCFQDCDLNMCLKSYRTYFLKL